MHGNCYKYSHFASAKPSVRHVWSFSLSTAILAHEGTDSSPAKTIRERELKLQYPPAPQRQKTASQPRPI